MNPRDDLHQFVSEGAENLRVLHIGNIANNGYNIANLLNQAGVESDLIIGPYYHVAGCPEWEDSEFEGDLGDHFYPHWHKVKITNGFDRPKWVAQGPWETCIRYHLNRNKGNKLRTKWLWFWLNVCTRTAADEPKSKIRLSNIAGSPKKTAQWLRFQFWRIKSPIYLFKRYLYISKHYFYYLVGYFLYYLKHYFYLFNYYLNLFKYYLNLFRYNVFLIGYNIKKKILGIIKFILISNDLTSPLFYKLRSVKRRRAAIRDKKTRLDDEKKIKLDDSATQPNVLQEEIIEKYNLQKEDTNGDELTEDSAEDELAQYRFLAKEMAPLFDFYDVVIGYSTDGIWPLLAGKKYIAYEHGTIRTIPFEDSPQGRLCKLVYQKADQVVISNFDNNIAAQRLGLERYTCIPHYINEMRVDPSTSQDIRARYERDFGTDFIVYNPSRQHWSENRDAGWEKGNDTFIKGFAEFVKKSNPKALAIMTHWGVSLPESKELIKNLDIVDNIEWVEPVPHKQMIQFIQAADVVSDQFLLETFGGIPAKAFMHGTPVLSSFNPKIHEWCFDQMPPFLPAKTVKNIVNSLNNCYENRDYYDEIAAKSAKWYENQHSNTVLLARMTRVMVDCITSS